MVYIRMLLIITLKLKFSLFTNIDELNIVGNIQLLLNEFLDKLKSFQKQFHFDIDLCTNTVLYILTILCVCLAIHQIWAILNSWAIHCSGFAIDAYDLLRVWHRTKTTILYIVILSNIFVHIYSCIFLYFSI